MADSATVTVTTTDGVTISLDQYGQGKRDTALILCPGFFQSKDTATFQRMSQALAGEYDVLAMDFRGHGRSSSLYTFSSREGTDLEAVLSWARQTYQRFGVIGFSLGGAIAINTVGRHHEVVRCLTTVSAPALFEEIEFQWWTPEAMRTGLQGMEQGAGCRPGNLFLQKRKPLEQVGQLAPMPVLFVHGTHDPIVGVNHSRRLYAAAGEPKRLEIIEDGGHAEALYRDHEAHFSRIVLDWCIEHLG